jgi:HK97 gp10 family phage protein
MKFSVRVEGGAELARNLNSLSTRLSRRIQTDALIEGAGPIQKSASAFAPREPGKPDLADNIGISPLRGGDPAVAVGPTKDFYYGLFQEEGTTRHGAQPFMRPAFDSEAQRSLAIIGMALWRELAGRGFSRTVESDGPIESDGPLL